MDWRVLMNVENKHSKNHTQNTQKPQKGGDDRAFEDIENMEHMVQKIKNTSQGGGHANPCQNIRPAVNEAITKEYEPIFCPYKGKPRKVHPAVCKWHREEKDPVCVESNCKRANWTEEHTEPVQLQMGLSQ